MEAQGALCATVFVGFPNADIRYAGLSAVVVTDNDPALARRWCDELLEMAWSQRAKFVYEVRPLAESIAQAKAIAAAKPAGSGPVVLLDHSDNCASGGTMDTMTVLGAILDAGLEDVAAFAIFDPQAVQQMIAAGVGRGHAVARRQARHAGHRAEGRAAHGDWHRAPDLRRPLPQPRSDGARRGQRHGPECSARHRHA